MVADEALLTAAAAVLFCFGKVALLLTLILHDKSIEQFHALRFITDTANLLKFLYVLTGIGLRRFSLSLLSECLQNKFILIDLKFIANIAIGFACNGDVISTQNCIN